MELSDVRKRIDKIDDELLVLLKQRMEAAKDVATIKKEKGIPILNTQRENEILDEISENSGEYANYMRIVYATLMDVSRGLQHKLLSGGEQLRQKIINAEKFDFSQKDLKVSCAGVVGAYADMAATKAFPNAEKKYCSRFEDVFLSVADGSVDYGIIPIENSSAGSVHENFDLIMKHQLNIAGAVDLPVEHCLVAKKGTDINSVKQVYSHIQGIAQCSEFIEKHKFSAVDYPNTAMAAQMVSESAENDIAAIASSLAAKEFGLEILERGIQNNSSNTTRFLILSKNIFINDDADKVSLIMQLPHITGSLYRVLGRFAMCGLNLTKLESRPLGDKNFCYNFYVDFSGNVKNEDTLDLLCALHDELPLLVFLGNYKEVK
ncbi:MAG: prephenate dehydratase [Clostridiales bacterium]|nr:prephenate dehydratase [Clostridiales bacterium]